MRKIFKLVLAFFVIFTGFILSNPYSGRSSFRNPLFSLNSAYAEEDDDPDHSSLIYRKATPSWSFGLRAAFLKFPTDAALGSTAEVYGEYLLPWQNFGILSFGPYFGLFPLYYPEGDIPYPKYSNTTVGGTVRYEMRYFANQLLVPTVGFDYNYYRVTTGGDTIVSGTDSGIRAGLMMSLSWIDEVTSRDAYGTIGLCRTYLTAEVRTSSMSNSLFSLSGNFWYWGLKMEFE